MDTVEIPLLRGGHALIQREDAQLIEGSEWRINSSGYVLARRGINRGALMHRLIMAPSAGLVVDHINHNKLDNRRCNLRVCSPAENARNRLRHADFSSRFKGVYWETHRGKWVSQIAVDGTQMRLGSFDDEERAAQQYDRAARLLHGAFGKTNRDLGLIR